MEQARQLPSHELIMSELMMPDTANFSGNVHGGELLRLLGIRVEAQNIRTGEVRHTNSCYFTMVAVENGKPVPVPPLEITTDRQRCRYEKAKKRKALSLQENETLSCR